MFSLDIPIYWDSNEITQYRVITQKGGVYMKARLLALLIIGAAVVAAVAPVMT